MKPEHFQPPKSTVLLVGLLVLAVVFSDARSVLGQTQEACPLPAGVAPPPAPPVTAQQVEDGSANLMDFALAVRDQFMGLGTLSLEQGVYFGCLIRQEGGPWRSGSNYLVQLSPDGRVFVHTKDMALAGRQLNLPIYLAVLKALGVNPADLANPATAIAALSAAIAGNGGAFNVPNVPGASGYATAYLSPTTQVPFVLLAGFDLNASHLAQEQIDYGNPTVTARDVVDRRTLKAFVTQAGNFVLDLQRGGDLAAVSKIRLALRDPNGPWRHGSVYLYTLDLTSNIILFHGANPDRYELRPLVPTVRDAVTGKLVLPQVIEAAKSSPEGGFVQYYFDDPADDTDSAEIPKVGYARQFTGEYKRADGSVLPVNYVIGSGIYLSSPQVITERQNTVVKSVLPQVMRAVTASTVDAISGRIQEAASGSPPAKEFSLGGASTLSDVLLANAQALGNNTFDPGRLLAGSSFSLPLNAAGTGRSGLLGNLTFWGSGDYRNFSGGNRKTLDYDGDVMSANLGVDSKLGADLLAGLSVARARGTADYTDSNALTGEFTTTLTSVNPYVGWQAGGGINLWATAGYGWGEVEVDDKAAEAQASELTQQMAAAGVSGLLMSSDQVIGGGTTSVRVKGETAFTRADVEGSGSLRSTTLNASRQRLMVEGRHVRKLASGVTLTPSIEIGVRYDGGDGETGGSVETVGGVRYTDAASGLTVEGRTRTLLAHSGDYEEWGVSGLLRLDPGAARRGLALSVRPAWGRTTSGVQRLWESGVSGGVAGANRTVARVKARIAYGIGATWGGKGVLTPYTNVSLSGEGSWRLGLGGRFDIGPSVGMSLEGVHSRSTRGATSHGVILRGDLNW